MRTLHQSDYVKIFYASEENILTYQWLSASATMPDQAFKQEMLRIPEISAEYRPTGFLEDNTQRDFIIRPELQCWISTEIAPHQFKYGTSYFALTNPPSYVAQLSTQQTMDEIKKQIKKSFNVAYFDDHPQAWEWLCLQQMTVDDVSII
ncbi:hypothetical protein [uncultured Microscilla sp.]|uniref:hypothetical protein n=1 Tax=uncultured Microscilla sp. TaxID=432653 RepID=UPI00260FEF57|nr:hypothetical protein [uncultured Microscilla sp.]